jgi:enoyl-CoA hydratase/carnithine racemase
MSLPPFTGLTLEREQDVLWLRLDRPEVMNSFTTTVYREVRDAFLFAAELDDVHTVIITARGRAFATGGDLNEVLTCVETNDIPTLSKFGTDVPWDAIRNCPKLTIAAVNGLALAGGFITSLCCDLVVAVEDAVFGIPEGLVGFSEPWSVHFLHQRIGGARARRMLLTARNVSAREALDMGLINEVVPADRLEDAARALAAEGRRVTPRSVADYKALLRELEGPFLGFDPLMILGDEAVLERLRSFRDKKVRP